MYSGINLTTSSDISECVFEHVLSALDECIEQLVSIYLVSFSWGWHLSYPWETSKLMINATSKNKDLVHETNHSPCHHGYSFITATTEAYRHDRCSSGIVFSIIAVINISPQRQPRPVSFRVKQNQKKEKEKDKRNPTSPKGIIQLCSLLSIVNAYR